MWDTQKILTEIEDKARREFLPIIGPKKGKILRELVSKNKPKQILEIGTLVGYSTILMASELGPDATITTIERDPDSARIAEQNIIGSNIRPTVKVVIGDAIEVLPHIRGQFDLVFIDADKHEYLRYLREIEDKIHAGSLVVADNARVCASQMRNYLGYVRTSGRYRSQFIPIDWDGLEVSVKL